MFNGGWHRILHDQTAESMAREIARLPHANVTTVPFHFDEPADGRDRARSTASPTANGAQSTAPTAAATETGTATAKAPRSTIVLGRRRRARPTTSPRRRHDADRLGALAPAGVRARAGAGACGSSRSAGSPSLECTLVDDTGGVSVVFFGRRHIEGVAIGATLTATGMAIEHRGRLAIVNPVYELR